MMMRRRAAAAALAAAALLFGATGAPAGGRGAVARTDAPVRIDGALTEAGWAAAPATALVHRGRDRSACTARFLWDDANLYVGFDVADESVETSEHDWDDDGVSISFVTPSGLKKFRFDIGATGEGTGHVAAGRLKPATTLDRPGDADAGFVVEMSIPWSVLGIRPEAGAEIPVEILSIDHDANPGRAWDAPGTRFSKVSLDGDQDIDTVKRTVRLVRDGGTATLSRSFPIPGGALGEWLLLGPFPTESIDEDRLGGEAACRPAAYAKAGEKEWRIVSTGAALNLEEPEAFGIVDDCVGYAAAWVRSPSEREALLLVGSDDGVKVWLNGRCVWRNDSARGLKADEDRIHVVLRSGWNLLLFKVKDIGGGYWLQARLADVEGAPLSGLEGAYAPPSEGAAAAAPAAGGAR